MESGAGRCDRSVGARRAGRSPRGLWAIAGLCLALGLGGCLAGHNYLDPAGPRYAGGTATATGPADSLRIVSFNIAFAREIDSALVVLRGNPELREADLLLLQEMDAAGTARIAAAMGMAYVYYPATKHFKTGRDFGTAVLSRWPIVADSKLLLPFPSRYSNTYRTATAATVRVGARLIRAYSVHLGTPNDVSAADRRAQLDAVFRDASNFDRVLIGGDMNNGSIGTFARERGYLWPTEHGPRTLRVGRWDMIFVRGMEAPANKTGTVLEVHRASDHVPIWATVLIY